MREIVITGGGYAGSYTAWGLEKRLRAGSAIEIRDADRRVVVRPVNGADHELSYDILVVTAGAVTRTFPIPGLAQQAIGLKHVEGAVAIRDRLMTAFDQAASLQPGAERRRLLTVTFVGGWFSGAEGFGELLSLATAMLRSYPELSIDDLSWRGVRLGADRLGCRQRLEPRRAQPHRSPGRRAGTARGPARPSSRHRQRTCAGCVGGR